MNRESVGVVFGIEAQSTTAEVKLVRENVSDLVEVVVSRVLPKGWW